MYWICVHCRPMKVDIMDVLVLTPLIRNYKFMILINLL